MKPSKTFKKRRKAMTPDMRMENDHRYLKAFNGGFDKRYCSGKVKFFTREEIAEYESQVKSAT